VASPFAVGITGVALVVTASAIGCSADPGDALKGEAGVSSAEAGGSSSGIFDDAGYGDATTSSSSSGIGTSSGSSSGVASSASSSSGVTSSSSSSSSGSSSGGMDAPVVAPCTTCLIELRYSDTTIGTTQDIRPHFKIYNNGTGTQDLAELKVRYYFTADGSQSQGFNLDYAANNIAVQSTFVAMTTPTATADHYLEMSLSGYSVAAGANSGEIQPRFHDSGYQVMFNQDNDYSYNSTAGGSFVDNMKMTVYRSGTLVWGTEPGGASASQDAGGQDAAQDAPGD
jgi:endoglucanase